jgi:hypothetical protein
VSYGYSRTRVKDAATGLRWNGDFDQRHTFNAYASYRWTSSLNLSTKYRYGSNFPFVGFLKDDNGRVVVSDQRNQMRIPAYSRLDVRANKAFHFDRFQLTLYGEVLNVTNRKNARYTTEMDSTNGRLSTDKDSMFPLLPIAGIKIDF